MLIRGALLIVQRSASGDASLPFVWSLSGRPPRRARTTCSQASNLDCLDSLSPTQQNFSPDMQGRDSDADHGPKAGIQGRGSKQLYLVCMFQPCLFLHNQRIPMHMEPNLNAQTRPDAAEGPGSAFGKG